MSLQILRKASSRTRNPNSLHPSSIFISNLTRSFSQLSSQSNPASSFGIAFDIDGVVSRSDVPIGGSPCAFKRLYDDSGRLRVPFVFLTNGGGFHESKRAHELGQLLGVKVSPSQVLQAHTPFKQLVSKFENELIVAVGKGEPAAVMADYGFRNVVSIDDYAACFENIDPLAPHKKWTAKNVCKPDSAIRDLVHRERVQAAFILSDPVDWSRDIQVLCDILRTGGLPGLEIGHQPQLYLAHDDLAYQYTTFGKPNPFVFRNAELALKQLVLSLPDNVQIANHETAGSHQFKTLYMVGDNPLVDIKGARQAGHPWISILTRTGVFKGKGNHDEFPADLVVDTVEEAVDYVLKKESIS